jgi:hypothetical protein
MKFAMRDERTEAYLKHSSGPAKWIIVGFFFHDRGSHIQKSIEGLLQAVLHQLLSQVRTLLEFVYPIYAELVQVQQKANPDWTFDSLCAAWVAITKQRTEPLSACIFLDALDEHDGDNSQLANFVYQLLSGADDKVVKIKICVASRTWNIFGEHFGTCPQFAIHEHTAGDIQAYTSERLSGPVISLGENSRLALLHKIEQLSSHVTTKARGVFIWVRIVVDELVKGIRDGTTLALLEEKVSKMPEELGDLYRHTLQRIEPEYVEEAYIMLQVTLCSLTPLPIETLIKCVSFTRWGKIYELSEDEMVRHLISRSGGLLEIIEIVESSPEIPQLVHTDAFRQSEDRSHSISESYPSEDDRHDVSRESDGDEHDSRSLKAVQFIHQTVKDFVAEHRQNLGLHLKDSIFTAESGYLFLLRCATTFGGSNWARDLSHSMWEYAFLAEAAGIPDMSRFSDIFMPMIIQATDSNEVFNVYKWTARELPQYNDYFRCLNFYDIFLILAAAADLKGLIAHEMSTYGENFPKDLHILVMVSTGPRLSTTSASRESMVKLLLKFEFDINAWTMPLELEDEELLPGTHFSRTPLAWVLRQESQRYISKEEAISLARLLLENGANPNTLAVPDPSCPDGTSLLYSCILHYDVEAVKLLLLHGADTSIINQQLMFHLSVMEKIRGETTMYDLLREYEVQATRAFKEMYRPARLMQQSMFAIGIGSSEIASIVQSGWPISQLADKPDYQLRI